MYVSGIVEKRRALYTTIVNSSMVEKTTHGLEVQFSFGGLYFNPNNYSQHEVMVSIYKPKWGVHWASGSTPTMNDGFDPKAGTPPGSTQSANWAHVPSPLGQGGQIANRSFVYFSDDDDEDAALTGSQQEFIVYRESARDSQSVEHTVVYIFTLGILKNRASGDCSIDTRKVFNNANAGNVNDWFLDANTALRNLTFDPYTFRGGLFVGYMPWDKQDRSGTSRSQLWFGDFDLSPYTSYSPELQFATTTLWDNGVIPSNDNSDPLGLKNGFDIRYYYGSSGTTPGATTWSNRWDTTLPGDESFTASIPAWTNADNAEYVNLPLTTASPSSASTNASILKWLYIRCKDEPGSTLRWRYFLSNEAVGETDGADKGPRCWGIWGIEFTRILS